MGNIQFRCQFITVGKHHETSSRYIPRHWHSLLQLTDHNGYLYWVYRYQVFLHALHNTFPALYFALVPRQFHCQKDKILKNLQIKTEIFLTKKQLCKHRRVGLERPLYSFTCPVLRHCTCSKLSKNQTRQRVATEAYNIASNCKIAFPHRAK